MKLLGLADTVRIEQSEVQGAAVSRLADQLNMAFLVYRGLVAKNLKEQAPTVASIDTAKVLIETSERIRSYWTANFSPNVKAGLQIGGLDDATASVLAGKYAGKMADQINEVSDRAFLEGYHAALNKGWDRALAWHRISEAYGLDPVQMRKWVSYYPEDGYHPQDIPDKSRDLLDRFLGERGVRIGEHEAWTIKQIGKQTHWQQRVASGEIPETAKKVWYTARDELVCPVCAPLDGLAIPISAEFDTGEGGFFVPPLHVNCRCEINLQFPEVVTKAMGDDPYDRDPLGRFSTRELRRATTITRGMRGQTQKKASTAFHVATVKKPKEEKIPYGLEMVVNTPEVKKVVEKHAVLTPQKSAKVVEEAKKRVGDKKKASAATKLKFNPEAIKATQEVSWIPISAINGLGLAGGGMVQDGGEAIDFDSAELPIAFLEIGDAYEEENDTYKKMVDTSPEYGEYQESIGLLIAPIGSAAYDTNDLGPVDKFSLTGKMVPRQLVQIRPGEKYGSLRGTEIDIDDGEYGSERTMDSESYSPDFMGVHDQFSEDLLRAFMSSPEAQDWIAEDGTWNGPSIDLYYGEPVTDE